MLLRIDRLFSTNGVDSDLTLQLAQDVMHLSLWIMLFLTLKGRFLLFRVYHNFANSFSKLSVSTIYKEISKFQQKVQS